MLTAFWGTSETAMALKWDIFLIILNFIKENINTIFEKNIWKLAVITLVHSGRQRHSSDWKIICNLHSVFSQLPGIF